MAEKKGFWQTIGDAIANFFEPGDKGPEGETTTAQHLQDAVKREIDLASARKQAAQSSMVTAGLMRKELAKLVAEHQALGKLALQKEQAGDTEGAKKILALQLKIQGRIEPKTQAYKEADQRTAELIVTARDQHKRVEEAKTELPQRVLQIELNRMREDAQKMEEEAAAQLTGAASFENLTKSIDMQTAVLDAGHLLTDTGEENLEAEVQKALTGQEFEKAYKQLQHKAQEAPGEVVEAELIEGGDAVDDAKNLLSGPAFGGALDKK